MRPDVLVVCERRWDTTNGGPACVLEVLDDNQQLWDAIDDLLSRYKLHLPNLKRLVIYAGKSDADNAD